MATERHRMQIYDSIAHSPEVMLKGNNNINNKSNNKNKTIIIVIIKATIKEIKQGYKKEGP